LTSLLEPRHPDYAEEVISFLKFSELFIIDFIVRISCTSSLSSVTFFATCVVSRTTQPLQDSSHPGHNNINDILETACRALFYLTAESPSDVFKEDVDAGVSLCSLQLICVGAWKNRRLSLNSNSVFHPCPTLSTTMAERF
jgi:hypothetical protein